MIKALADEAMRLADRHQTAPEPIAFELWYAYADGGNLSLNNVIETRIADGAPLSEDDLYAIHDAYFSSRRLNAGVNRVSADAGVALSETAQDCEHAAARFDQFDVELRSVAHSIGLKAPPEEVAELVDAAARVAKQQSAVASELRESLREHARKLAEAVQELETLRDDAYRDHLTNLKNRRFFDGYLQNQIDDCRRNAAPLSIAIADLDRFKKINDQWGHSAGDFILKKFAQILDKNMRGKGVAARIGGEEFALVFPGAPLNTACVAADEIRAYVATTKMVAGGESSRPHRITVSFGVTELRADDDLRSLMARADASLYAAKRAGRNVVRDSA